MYSKRIVFEKDINRGFLVKGLEGGLFKGFFVASPLISEVTTFSACGS